MTGHVVIPGMVNTHHHLFQNLTRLIPEAQNESLFGWLQTLYPIWMNLEPDDFYISAALGELAGEQVAKTVEIIEKIIFAQHALRRMNQRPYQ